jgi:N-methylhydantoinase A/oxoprolinase/acetone carboxylase beta subunit
MSTLNQKEAEPMTNVEILGIDTGGTMTDTIFVDSVGLFTVGKAQTVPEDEPKGIDKSIDNALSYWNIGKEQVLPQINRSIYSGTAMINRLLSRTGRKTGLIITKGLEDTLRLEKAVQTWLGKSYEDRLHSVTHEHNDPLIPLERIRGVRERIDPLGDIAIPLYEKEAAQAVEELLDQDIEALCICFLFSYLNPAHEEKVKEIALGVMERLGKKVPLFLSSEVHPYWGEFPRLNTVIAEAYAAEPSRQQIIKVENILKQSGSKADLRIMASHGGTIDLQTRQLSRSLLSGPIGGLVGAKYLGEKLNLGNILASDLGGTTFDIGVVTKNRINISLRPVVSHFLFNLPMVDVTSVGVGSGAILSFDEYGRRVKIGPVSAGDQVGLCYEEGSVTQPTITDCALILGLLNPNYFLGGEIILNKQRAFDGLRDQIASKFGKDTYETASGIIDMQEARMRDELRAVILGKGYAFSDYVLLSYGGAGPLHVGNYSHGLGFKDIIIPTWAAAFSAFGCTCAPYEYRFDKSIMLYVPPIADDQTKMAVAEGLNKTLDALEERVVAEFALKGYDKSSVELHSIVRMQYKGQVTDLEILSPKKRVLSPQDVDELIKVFEKHYTEIYTRSARFPEAGFLITGAASMGAVTTKMPELPSQEMGPEMPAKQASKGKRDVYWKGQWMKADILEMDKLRPGNFIEGLSIIEDPATTLVVPPGKNVYLDQHRIFHMREQ